MELAKLSSLRKVNKIPSDVFEFDVLTRGGIPEGRFTLFWGAKSSGKSTMALRIAKNFLKLYPDRKVCYLDFEQAFDPDWALRILEEDNDNFLVAQPIYAEEGIKFLQESTNSSDVGLYIIDSLAMMIPISEAEAEADQDFIGLQARTINKMFKRVLPNIARHTREGNPVTFILINQLRNDIGNRSFVKSFSKPGGVVQDFIVSLDVRFYVDSVEKDSEGRPLAITFSFVIEKNKVGGTPKVMGKYVMDMEGKIIDENRILNALKKLELLQKDKDGYLLCGQTFRTQGDIKDKLKEDIQFKRDVIKLFY